MLLALLALSLLAALVALAGGGSWLLRREREQRALLAAQEQRLEQLHLRLEVTEQDLALALAQSGVAEGLLLEKGIADVDEVEDMRRRLGTDGAPSGEGDVVH
jgi:hypothetical protein